MERVVRRRTPWARPALTPTAIPGLSPVYRRRAVLALDAIKLATEGKLRLQGKTLSPYGVTDVFSSDAYRPSDAKIVRAALRALHGDILPERTMRAEVQDQPIPCTPSWCYHEGSTDCLCGSLYGGRTQVVVALSTPVVDRSTTT